MFLNKSIILNLREYNILYTISINIWCYFITYISRANNKGDKRQWKIIKHNNHFAAVAVWCALRLDNERLVISRFPEDIDDGVLGLFTEDVDSFFLVT